MKSMHLPSLVPRVANNSDGWLVSAADRHEADV